MLPHLVLGVCATSKYINRVSNYVIIISVYKYIIVCILGLLSLHP